MGPEADLYSAVNLFYEAVLDETLWAPALIKLGDAMGAGQVALTAIDLRAQKFDSIAPRTDPIMEANFKAYWAFHNPVFPRLLVKPLCEVYPVESLMPRQELCATQFYDEWFRPAEFQIATLGANLRAENQIATLLFATNPRGKDKLTNEEISVFKTGVRHINRAIHFHRELRLRDLDRDTAPERLEHLPKGIMLVDGTARLLYANAAARQLLDSGRGLTVKAGCVHSTDSVDAIQGLIASCAQKVLTLDAPGGEMSICLGPNQNMRVTVSPLRSNGTVAELAWLGLLIPAAIVTVASPSHEISLN